MKGEAMFASYRKTAGAALIVLAAVCAGSHPAAAQRSWHVSGSGSFVVAADCSNCDDVGIRFECRGLGRAADVSVPVAGVEQRPSGSRHRIEFFVDGLGMAYDAEIEWQGLVRYVPTLSIRQNDPLIERLAAGSSLRVVFEGKSTDITLNGARAALAAFASQCAWSNAKDLARPLAAEPARQPPAAAGASPDRATAQGSPRPTLEHQEMRWQFFAGGGGEASRLVFGVPGDVSVLVASCLPGATRALVALTASPPGLKPGRPVEIGIHTSRGIKGVRGVVNQSAHATFASDPNGLLWTTLRAGGAATLSVSGRPAGFVESGLADRNIENFLAGCR